MLNLKASKGGMEAASQRVAYMLMHLRELKPFMEAGADYMVRSTRHRIRQGTTSPDGSTPPALAALTELLKGHNNPWYSSGNLYRGITKDRVTEEGFVIRASARSPKGFDYAQNVQLGNETQKGVVTTPDGRRVFVGKPSPARPFLGFSEENLRRLERMLKEHVLKQGPG